MGGLVGAAGCETAAGTAADDPAGAAGAAGALGVLATGLGACGKKVGFFPL